MTRRSARILLVPAMLFALVAGAGTSSHAAASTVCRASFVASFAPALQGSAGGTSSLSISGTLSQCVGGAVSDANVSAGNVWTDPVTGYQWQEPKGTVTGTCINNATSATTIARWSDGGVSITEYSSNSLTYGILTNGVNVASVTLAAANQQAGQPDTLTVDANRDIGATMAGLLFAADANDPANSGYAEFNACSGSGLASVALNGSENFAG